MNWGHETRAKPAKQRSGSKWPLLAALGVFLLLILGLALLWPAQTGTRRSVRTTTTTTSSTSSTSSPPPAVTPPATLPAVGAPPPTGDGHKTRGERGIGQSVVDVLALPDNLLFVWTDARGSTHATNTVPPPNGTLVEVRGADAHPAVLTEADRVRIRALRSVCGPFEAPAENDGNVMAYFDRAFVGQPGPPLRDAARRPLLTPRTLTARTFVLFTGDAACPSAARTRDALRALHAEGVAIVEFSTAVATDQPWPVHTLKNPPAKWWPALAVLDAGGTMVHTQSGELNTATARWLHAR